MTSLVLGFAVIVVPSSGFLFRDPALYGITDGQYGLLFLPMVIATIATGFGYAGLSARFGRPRVFGAGFFFTFLYLLLVLIAGCSGQRPTLVFVLLMLAQTMLGFGFALLMSSVSVFSIELFPNHRTSVLTAIHAMFGAGALLSPLVLDLWYRARWWQGLVVTGIAELLVVAAAALIGRSVPAEPPASSGEDESANPLRLLARLPGRAQAFVAALVLYGTIEAVVANWSTIYLTRERGFGVTTAAICLSLFWGFLTVGRIAATIAAMRMDSRVLFRAAPFVVTAGLLLLKSVRSEAAVFLPYMVIGFGCSCTFPVSVSLTTRYHDSLRQILPSFMLAGLMAGVGGGSTAVGFFRGAGLCTLEQAFTGALAAAAALCVIFFLLTQKSLSKL